ncbi:MAG: carbohydrate-binding domain-containing protein [Spirochaetaceae bacterium]|jgi:hypothetical protein|nr:carbohydrate-binding domain-containing protein [Spirochaetaceae bacterium]
MKGFMVLMILWALLVAACAIPLGEDYIITRDGAAGLTYITDYNLQTYVPIPAARQRPVTLVNDREDLEMRVVWKDEAGAAIPLPFDAFAANTVYRAEIKIVPKPGYGFYSTPFVYPIGKISVQIDDLGDSARTVTVTYNNSDDWEITFITDYNLQSYVPIPLAGERPVRTIDTRTDVKIQATWYEEITPGNYQDLAPDPYVFTLGSVYRADIRLTAKPGYRFIPGRNFTYADDLTITPGETSSDVRRFELTYRPTVSSTVINDLNLTPYIAKPIGGGTPVMSFTGSQYSGIVNWKNTGTQEVLIGPFQPDTAYTAELALSPGSGYTFTGLGADAFIHSGAAAVTSPAGGGSVTLAFPPTAGAGSSTIVYDTILTRLLPKPVNGVTPVTAITGSQYSGTVAWTPADSTFHLGVNYTAVLTLTAAPGYTFTGIGPNVFSHGDAPGTVTNPPGSGTVTIAFSTARPPSYSVMNFGPPEETTSALALLKARSAANDQVFIELPPGSEPVPYGAALTHYVTSPATVIIDGHGRTLTKTSPGTLITVGANVILTLQNITLRGHANNNAPLVTVQHGGKLILGSGAVLTGNDTDSDAGGIWVNGGTLIMNHGAMIKEMAALRAGGVLIDNGGDFILVDGTIGGTDPGDGNRVKPLYSGGGGVLVAGGFFDMYGGVIASNKAEAEHSGGGVAVSGRGSFTHHAGTITKNTAHSPHSGGGVCAFWDSYFPGSAVAVTIRGTAVIAGNTAWADESGGGLYDDSNGELVIEGGTIRGNTSKGVSSGGGIYAETPLSMEGGLITENTAEGLASAGGIYAQEFDYSGGTVSLNTAQEAHSGGGIYARIGGTLSGATVSIEGNRALEAHSAGGVYVGDNMVFSIRRGAVKDNTAWGPASAGGIYVYGNAEIYPEYSGAPITIKGNRALWNGAVSGNESAGAIYVAGGSNPGGRFGMAGGIIGGAAPGDANTAIIGANGVYVAGMFQLGYGEITGNTGYDNYGVYVANTDLEAFSLSEGAAVDPSNLVFLAEDAVINLSYHYTQGGATIANLACDNPRSYTDYPSNPTKLLCVEDSADSSLMDLLKPRFLYRGAPLNIQTSQPITINIWTTRYYGYYEP